MVHLPQPLQDIYEQQHEQTTTLNDCLLKGPPTLVDLYTVTFGMKEHRVMFTKDTSELYQFVKTDETAPREERPVESRRHQVRSRYTYLSLISEPRRRHAGCIAML
jgi:hypothetical protein